MKKELITPTLVVVIFLAIAFYFSKNTNMEMDNSTTNSSTLKTPDVVTELKVEDVVIGTGTEAVSGKKLSMHYVGTLLNGVKFDSSRDRGTPFEFVLGAGQVIKGWDQGISGMKVGGKRILTIPPSLAYGSSSVGSIPSNSTLVFEVELLGVK